MAQSGTIIDIVNSKSGREAMRDWQLKCKNKDAFIKKLENDFNQLSNENGINDK